MEKEDNGGIGNNDKRNSTTTTTKNSKYDNNKSTSPRSGIVSLLKRYGRSEEQEQEPAGRHEEPDASTTTAKKNTTPKSRRSTQSKSTGGKHNPVFSPSLSASPLRRVVRRSASSPPSASNITTNNNNNSSSSSNRRRRRKNSNMATPSSSPSTSDEHVLVPLKRTKSSPQAAPSPPPPPPLSSSPYSLRRTLSSPRSRVKGSNKNKKETPSSPQPSSSPSSSSMRGYGLRKTKSLPTKKTNQGGDRNVKNKKGTRETTAEGQQPSPPSSPSKSIRLGYGLKKSKSLPTKTTTATYDDLGDKKKTGGLWPRSGRRRRRCQSSCSDGGVVVADDDGIIVVNESIRSATVDDAGVAIVDHDDDDAGAQRSMMRTSASPSSGIPHNSTLTSTSETQRCDSFNYKISRDPDEYIYASSCGGRGHVDDACGGGTNGISRSSARATGDSNTSKIRLPLVLSAKHRHRMVITTDCHPEKDNRNNKPDINKTEQSGRECCVTSNSTGSTDSTSQNSSENNNASEDDNNSPPLSHEKADTCNNNKKNNESGIDSCEQSGDDGNNNQKEKEEQSHTHETSDTNSNNNNHTSCHNNNVSSSGGSSQLPHPQRLFSVLTRRRKTAAAAMSRMATTTSGIARTTAAAAATSATSAVSAMMRNATASVTSPIKSSTTTTSPATTQLATETEDNSIINEANITTTAATTSEPPQQHQQQQQFIAQHSQRLDIGSMSYNDIDDDNISGKEERHDDLGGSFDLYHDAHDHHGSSLEFVEWVDDDHDDDEQDDGGDCDDKIEDEERDEQVVFEDALGEAEVLLQLPHRCRTTSASPDQHDDDDERHLPLTSSVSPTSTASAPAIPVVLPLDRSVSIMSNATTASGTSSAATIANDMLMRGIWNNSAGGQEEDGDDDALSDEEDNIVVFKMDDLSINRMGDEEKKEDNDDDEEILVRVEPDKKGDISHSVTVADDGDREEELQDVILADNSVSYQRDDDDGSGVAAVVVDAVPNVNDMEEKLHFVIPVDNSENDQQYNDDGKAAAGVPVDNDIEEEPQDLNSADDSENDQQNNDDVVAIAGIAPDDNDREEELQDLTPADDSENDHQNSNRVAAATGGPQHFQPPAESGIIDRQGCVTAATLPSPSMVCQPACCEGGDGREEYHDNDDDFHDDARGDDCCTDEQILRRRPLEDQGGSGSSSRQEEGQPSHLESSSDGLPDNLDDHACSDNYSRRSSDVRMLRQGPLESRDSIQEEHHSAGGRPLRLGADEERSRSSRRQVNEDGDDGDTIAQIIARRNRRKQQQESATRRFGGDAFDPSRSPLYEQRHDCSKDGRCGPRGNSDHYGHDHHPASGVVPSVSVEDIIKVENGCSSSQSSVSACTGISARVILAANDFSSPLPLEQRDERSQAKDGSGANCNVYDGRLGDSSDENSAAPRDRPETMKTTQKAIVVDASGAEDDDEARLFHRSSSGSLASSTTASDEATTYFELDLQSDQGTVSSLDTESDDTTHEKTTIWPSVGMSATSSGKVDGGDGDWIEETVYSDEVLTEDEWDEVTVLSDDEVDFSADAGGGIRRSPTLSNRLRRQQHQRRRSLLVRDEIELESLSSGQGRMMVVASIAASAPLLLTPRNNTSMAGDKRDDKNNQNQTYKKKRSLARHISSAAALPSAPTMTTTTTTTTPLTEPLTIFSPPRSTSSSSSSLSSSRAHAAATAAVPTTPVLIDSMPVSPSSLPSSSDHSGRKSGSGSMKSNQSHSWKSPGSGSLRRCRSVCSLSSWDDERSSTSIGELFMARQGCSYVWGNDDSNHGNPGFFSSSSSDIRNKGSISGGGSHDNHDTYDPFEETIEWEEVTVVTASEPTTKCDNGNGNHLDPSSAGSSLSLLQSPSPQRQQPLHPSVTPSPPSCHRDFSHSSSTSHSDVSLLLRGPTVWQVQSVEDRQYHQSEDICRRVEWRDRGGVRGSLGRFHHRLLGARRSLIDTNMPSDCEFDEITVFDDDEDDDGGLDSTNDDDSSTLRFLDDQLHLMQHRLLHHPDDEDVRDTGVACVKQEGKHPAVSGQKVESVAQEPVEDPVHEPKATVADTSWGVDGPATVAATVTTTSTTTDTTVTEHSLSSSTTRDDDQGGKVVVEVFDVEQERSNHRLDDENGVGDATDAPAVVLDGTETSDPLGVKFCTPVTAGVRCSIDDPAEKATEEARPVDPSPRRLADKDSPNPEAKIIESKPKHDDGHGRADEGLSAPTTDDIDAVPGVIPAGDSTCSNACDGDDGAPMSRDSEGNMEIRTEPTPRDGDETMLDSAVSNVPRLPSFRLSVVNRDVEVNDEDHRQPSYYPVALNALPETHATVCLAFVAPPPPTVVAKIFEEAMRILIPGGTIHVLDSDGKSIVNAGTVNARMLDILRRVNDDDETNVHTMKIREILSNHPQIKDQQLRQRDLETDLLSNTEDKEELTTRMVRWSGVKPSRCSRKLEPGHCGGVFCSCFGASTATGGLGE